MSQSMFWIFLVVMLLGVVGTLLPALPGTPLIFLAALGYGFYEGFAKITPIALGILFVMMAASLIVDYLAGVAGAKRYGASRYGTWGSFIGGVAGVIFFSIPGLLIGPFFGAVVGELISGRNAKEALKVGFGTVLGLAGGAFVKLVIAISMVAVFIIYAV